MADLQSNASTESRSRSHARKNRKVRIGQAIAFGIEGKDHDLPGSSSSALVVDTASSVGLACASVGLQCSLDRDERMAFESDLENMKQEFEKMKMKAMESKVELAEMKRQYEYDSGDEQQAFGQSFDVTALYSARAGRRTFSSSTEGDSVHGDSEDELPEGCAAKVKLINFPMCWSGGRVVEYLGQYFKTAELQSLKDGRATVDFGNREEAVFAYKEFNRTLAGGNVLQVKIMLMPEGSEEDECVDIGDVVELTDLKSAAGLQLNGCSGVITHFYEKLGRYGVDVGGQTVKIKIENMVLLGKST
jgi:hypothetical protein